MSNKYTITDKSPYVVLAALHVVGQVQHTFFRETTIADVAIAVGCSKYKAQKLLEKLREQGKVYRQYQTWRGDSKVIKYILLPQGKRDYDTKMTTLPFAWIQEGRVKDV